MVTMPDHSEYQRKWLQAAIDGGHIIHIPYANFEGAEVVARGAFGEVSRAYWKSAEKQVALKSLYSNPVMGSEASFEEFVKELKLIRSVDFHDNVIRFFGVSEDLATRRYFMVLQYANGGNLRDFLNKNFEFLNWKTKILMASQISSGLKCIHENNIVHRDLHSKNILAHDGKMMITDFGLSKSLDNNENSVVGGMVGYIEPQCFVDSTYKRDKASDIYSLGVLLWEISSGRPPFNNMAILDIAREVVQGKREAPIKDSPSAYVRLYQMAWDNDPNKRPTVNHVREGLELLNSVEDVDSLDFSGLSMNSQSPISENNNFAMNSSIPFGVAESMNPNIKNKRATIDSYIKLNSNNNNNNNNPGQLMSPPNSNEVPTKPNGIPNSIAESMNPHRQNSIIENLPFGVASSMNPHRSNTASAVRGTYVPTSTAPIPNLNSNNNVINIPQPQVPQVPQAQQSNQYQQNNHSTAIPVGSQQNFSQANNHLQNQFPQNLQNPANIQKNSSISYNRPNLMMPAANSNQGFQGNQQQILSQPQPQSQQYQQRPSQPQQSQPQPQLQPLQPPQPRPLQQQSFQSQPRPPQQQSFQSQPRPPQPQQTMPYQQQSQQYQTPQPAQQQPQQPPQPRPYQPQQQTQPQQPTQQRPYQPPQPHQPPQPQPYQPPQPQPYPQQPQQRPPQQPQQPQQRPPQQPQQPQQRPPQQPQQPQQRPPQQPQQPQQRPPQQLQQPQQRPLQQLQQPQQRPPQQPQPQPPYQQPQHHSNQFPPNNHQYNPMAQQHTLHGYPNVQNPVPQHPQQHTLRGYPNVQNPVPQHPQQQHYSNQYPPGMNPGQPARQNTNQFPPHRPHNLPPQRPNVHPSQNPYKCTCSDTMIKYKEQHQKTLGYKEPRDCNAGYHAGMGDVVGLRWHLYHDRKIDGTYNFVDLTDKLVFIAAKFCGRKKLNIMFQCLKDYGANFKSTTKKKEQTAMHLLYFNLSLSDKISAPDKLEKYKKVMFQAIKFLRESGCDINAIDSDGMTILSYFLVEKYNHQEKSSVIKALLGNNANPNIPVTIKDWEDFDAKTALLLAVKNKWPPSVLEVILKSGVDVKAVNKDDMNVLAVAAQNKDQDTLAWLLDNVYILNDSESIKIAKKISGKVGKVFNKKRHRSPNDLSSYSPTSSTSSVNSNPSSKK